MANMHDELLRDVSEFFDKELSGAIVVRVGITRKNEIVASTKAIGQEISTDCIMSLYATVIHSCNEAVKRMMEEMADGDPAEYLRLIQRYGDILQKVQNIKDEERREYLIHR